MLSTDQVKKVASLGRLKLTPEEEQKYTEQLSSILEYVDQLQNADTAQVEQSLALQPYDELREDVSDGGRYQTQLIAGAPKTKNQYVVVPPVFSEE